MGLNRIFIGLLVFIISMFCFSSIHAQIFSRLEADFSIKEKDISGNKLLTIGKVYFDKNIRKIVLDIHFPEKVIVVASDSLVYMIKNDSLVKTSSASVPIDFTVYNLCLNGQLAFYGLKDTPYKLEEVENDNGMIITTWNLPEEKSTGKLMLSQKDKKLTGMINFDLEGIILSKQFYEDYISVDGVEFPTKMIQYIFVLDQKTIKVTSHRNIKINEMDNNNFYDYPIPLIK